MPMARLLGNYLKAADLGGPGGTHIVRIETPGEHRQTELRSDLALELSVAPVDPPAWKTGGSDPKDWTLNRTSEGTLRNSLGENTDDWVNKHTRVNAVKQNVMGNLKDVLYSEALAPEDQPKQATTLSSTPPAQVETPTVTVETRRYLRYNEQLIGNVIDESTWNTMPKFVNQELARLNLIVYKDGYPTLSPNAAQVLT